MAENQFKFQPIRGKQADIFQQYKTPHEGFVYFAYDTGNIYLDKNERRYLMGGNSTGIVYGHGTDATIIKVEPDDEHSFLYSMSFSILDDSTVVPHPDTLILNSDGRFFRITEVDNNAKTIQAILLAVSGSGSGGGGTIITYSDRAKLNKQDPESNYLINGKEASINIFAISGKDYDGSILDQKLTVYWTLAEKENTGLYTVYAQGNFPINASTEEAPIWEAFEYGTKARHSTENLLTMYVKGSASTDSREITYTFFTSDLQLLAHTNFNNVNTYTPSGVTIYCSTVGNLQKIIYYYFEDSNGIMELLNPGGTVVPAGTNEQSYHVPEVLATHGAHKVRIELYQYINGKTDFTSSATPIEMEIAVVDPNSDLPIIWLGKYNEEYYQYDSIKIPFRVYDPNATLGATITLFKDGVKTGTRIITDNDNFSIWEIVDADLNYQNYYTIACGSEENEVRKEISFLVSEDPNRTGMKITEAGLRYVFNASGRSNSEAAASRIKCAYRNGDTVIDAQLENFNWYNNGWVIDSDGNSCLRISNGAKFTIPLGQTKFATTNASNQSHTFEFQFKVRNVQDYSQIIHNVTRYRANTEASHGRTFGNWTDDFSYNGDPSVYQAYMDRTYLEWSNGRTYDNYDAFLQWYLPEYTAHNPELLDPNQQIFPPSYDDLEFRKVEKILNTNYASGRYYDGIHGICIGAQDALFTNGVDTVNVAYVEDKLINLTVVYTDINKLMSIYLNGMLTGVATSTLNGSWNIGESNALNIIFDSQYCDFDLYKIRIYNQGLTLSSIVTNYMVDLKDPVGYDLSQLAVLNNSLNESQFVYENMVNYNNEHPDGYIMPYLILTTNPTQGNVLPYSKQIPITDVQMEFVNTGLDRAYVTGELNELAERAGQTVEEYYMHHCPSWKGEHIELKIQGTSSEFYPRRNYKAKTKNFDPADETKTKNVQMYMNRGPFAQQYVEDKPSTHLDWFYMDNDTVGTTKFTLKIDYMESSGTYNMGFANLVKNAYTHHPYYDYIKAGAFQSASTDYSAIDLNSATYDDNKTYWYKNHKGNFKNTTDDELKTIHDEADPAACFAMGPYAYGTSIGQSKVNADDNNWYEAVTVYSDIGLSDIKLNDLRTSVQGFPVLTFHQKTDETGALIGAPVYIGRYNMLLDKGSDEAYGFKMDNVYQKFITKKGAPTKISKVAECWEGENNSRGFCSFRDAATNRAADDDRFFETDKLTAKGAPVVADYWEYRYNDKADSLDILYELNEKLNDEDSIATVLDQCGVDISNPNAATSPDDKYNGIYTQGMADAGVAMLDIYKNWEKAVQWVWSTDQDSVPSAGIYRLADVGTAVYAANTYYIADTSGNELTYVLDSSNEYDTEKTYYSNNTGTTVIKLCASSDLLYAANKFYVDSGLGDYVLDPDGTFNADIEYYYLDKDEEHSGAAQLAEPVVYNGITYNYDTKEYRNAKFVNDLTKHFNLEYLVTYFVMTEVFECYDSRGKNMMMASWGPQTAGGEYIWYPIFYDIDTQLGINNTGIPSFEYYVDATEDGTFSTNDSVLYNNLYRNFKGAIIQKYRQLRGTSSTYDALLTPPLQSIDRIEKWYLADPVECKSLAMRGERPLIALNLDEYYKYITITNTRTGGGYQDRYGTISYDNGTYFYMLQGNRSLSRQQFLINRLNYIDSWLNQGQYERGGNNVIRGRISANKPSVQSDKWIEGTNKNTEANLITNEPYWQDAAETIKTHMFDGEYWVDMEPVRNSYVTVGTDAANFPSQKYTNLNGPVHFIATDLENGIRSSGGYAEQLFYIYGIDQMKSLGDMSKLYWTELEFQTNAAKMTDLLLGYDGVDENYDLTNEDECHYHHNNVNMYSLRASNSASDKGGMPLLKKANLSYITFNDAAPTFNFSSCEKLSDFRAIGSNITNVTFADGVALRTLYLPASIRALNLTEATQLKNIVTEFRVRDDTRGIDVKEGLYIPGLTDAATPQDATSEISTINLMGDYLGYDSYKLLENYYAARSGASASYITITGVDWSPYKKLTKGAEYSAEDANNNLYWLDDGHYSFVPYTNYSAESWNLAIQNEELYKLDTTIALQSSTISDTTLLENLKTNDKFFSTASEDNAIPIITGTIFVDNAVAVNEKDIETNLSFAYPDVKFFFRNVNKVPSAKYVILNDDGTYDLLARRSLGENESFFPDPSTLISQTLLDNYDTRSQYDFYGWSTEALSPAAVSAFGDEEWHLESKGHLIKTTSNANVIAVGQQYNNWASQTPTVGQNDYVFYAVYYVHKYKMTYYDGNNDVAAVVYVPAESFITDYPAKVIPSKNESNLSLTQTYHWIGWSFRQGGTAEAWTHNNVGKSQRDRDFYAVFEEASIYDVDYSDYFDVNSPTKSYRELERETGTTLYNVDEGIELWPAPSAEKVIIGKVVIPSTWNGKTVIGIGNFWRQPGITHVFFADNHQLRYIASNCFTQSTEADVGATKALKYFDFNTLTALREIQNGAFRIVNNLCLVDSLGDNATSVLFRIGENAFNGAFGRNRSASYNMLHIPASVTIMGSYAFAYQKFTKHTISLEIGNSLQHSHLRLTPLNSASLYPTETIYENNGYEYIGQNRDQGYKYIDFYSLNYSNDTGDNELMTKLLNMLGLNRDSGSGAPETFTLHNGANNWQLINNT